MAITQSLIVNAQFRAQQAWPGSQIEKANKVYAQAAVALLEHQTAKFQYLTDPNKEYTAHVWWPDPCFGDTVVCAPKCTLTGTDINTNGQDYTLNICRDGQGRSISERQFRTNQAGLEEFIALYINRTKKAMDEWIAQQVLLKAKAYAGLNFFPGMYASGANVNGTTYIPDADFTVRLEAYLEKVADYAQMESHFTISNDEFWFPLRNAQLDRGNLAGIGDGLRADLINRNFYWDGRNFNKAGLTEEMFIIEDSAMLLLGKAEFPETPYLEMGTVTPQWRWSEMSNVLPTMRYDFYMNRTCDNSYSATTEDFKINLGMRWRGGIFENPLGCTQTYNGVTGQTTGIISITKGAVPA